MARAMSRSALSMPALSGDTSLTSYLNEIRRFPILTPQEKYMLALRYLEHGDSKAAHPLVTSHLRLLAKVAPFMSSVGRCSTAFT
jgi:RNA polymerase sigma-32 factor